jgi:cytochrome c oxidase subunit 4
MSQDHNGHVVSYKFNILVWIDLLIFTIITIEVAQFDLQNLTVVMALLVASIKTFLVGTYFMHLKFENRFMQAIVIGVAVLFVLVLILLFSDYLFFN